MSTLNRVITPVDATVDWVVTDGGSAIRCDVWSMRAELAEAPAQTAQTQAAQTLEVLRAFRIDAITSRVYRRRGA